MCDVVPRSRRRYLFVSHSHLSFFLGEQIYDWTLDASGQRVPFTPLGDMLWLEYMALALIEQLEKVGLLLVYWSLLGVVLIRSLHGLA